MAVVVVCPTCGTRNHTDDATRGHDVECAFCFARIHVPATEHEAPVDIPGFQILESIGTGSNGRVYKAVQLSMSREVALKIIPRANLRRKEDVKRFMNEVRLLARMDHPHIVAAYEAGETDDYYYLAMTFIDGEPLDRILETKGFMPEDEALKLVIDLAQALSYAWERHRVLHRDIKPGNIMIDRYGHVRLMDLGISKTVGGTSSSAATAVGMVVGTPYYMSPEQAVSSSGMDNRSDIYSLGATLFEMVTGTKPFEGENPLEVMGHHRFTPLPSPRSRNRRVSVNCASLIETMMAKNMSDRYQTWDELIHDLKRVAGGLQPKRQPPGKRRQDGAMTADTKPRLPALPATAGKPRLQTPAHPAPPAVPQRSNFVLIFSLTVLAVGVLAVGIYTLRTRQSPPPPSGPALAVPGPTPPVPPSSAPSPAPSPTPAPAPAVPDPQAAQALARWQAALAAADTFAEENPTRFEAVGRRYRELLPDAPDEESRARLGAIIASLERQRLAASSKVMTDLAAKALPLAAAQQLARAAAIYRDYHGPMARETAPDRLFQANLLSLHEARAALDLMANRVAAHELTSRLAPLLVAGRLDEARKLAEAATQHPGLGKLPEILDLAARLEGLADADRRILASFQEEIDREIKLQLGDATVQAIVKAIGPGSLDVQIVERHGETVARLKRTIRYEELAPAERARRLGKADDPASILAKGLLALAAGHAEIAEKAFIQVDNRLADALLGVLRQRQGEAANALAAEVLGGLFSRLGLGSERESVPELVLSLWGLEPEQSTLAPVAAGIERYRLIYGGTDFAPRHRAATEAAYRLTAYRPVLRALPLAELSLQELVALLAAANPGLAPASVMLREDETGFLFNAAGNQALVDLSPLTALPLASLDISGTKVENLNWLRGMPLRRCVLSRTPVTDLKPLRGLPIAHLDLSFTAVADLRPLAGCPVRELNLEGALSLVDYSPLAACSRLERLAVANPAAIESLRHLPRLREIGDRWEALGSVAAAAELPPPPPAPAAPASDQAALDELKAGVEKAVTALKAANPAQKQWSYTLSVSPGEVRLSLAGNESLENLAPLAGQPITHLVLDRTGVRGLEPLAKLPLVSLSLAQVDFRDLEPLRKMPLTRLDLSGTKVTDLDLLAGLPLAVLVLDQTRVRDLRPLAKLPLVELRLYGCERIADFSPLLGCTQLERLSVSARPKDLEPLRQHPSLKYVEASPQPAWTQSAEAFWKR